MSIDVNSQITDGLTQANLTVLGTGPAIGVMQSQLSLSQATGVLFANMVSNQSQLSLSSNAAMTEGVMTLLGSVAPKANNKEGELAKVLEKMSDVIQKQLAQLDNTLATS
ncbi:MAG: hypothetical protein EP335_11635 [Alphaproteobacteria bacterium]|nr:MAG: hypothetical protein EP335_11635 [Alphaproteobacteria bacterium]